MKHAFFFLVFVVLLLSVSTGQAAYPAKEIAQERVILGTVNFPPYEIEKPEKGLKGFDAEVITEVFKRMKVPLDIRFVPWKRAVQTAKTGLITGIFSCSKRNIFHISAPISTATNALYVRKDFDLETYKITTIEDLAKHPELTVGGVSAYGHLKKLDQFDISYDISPDDATVFKKLFAGRVDVFLTIKEFADYTLRKLELSNLTKHITLDEKTYHVCFSKSRKGSEELRDRFNATLETVIKDGTYDSIHAKYK